MAAYPLNVRQQASRLDVRKQFYSQRVVNGWNKVFKMGIHLLWRSLFFNMI